MSSASPFEMVGTNLKGKTIGIMGLGRIGLAVAKRFSGFEIGKIIYTATKPKPEAGHLEHVTFEKLLADSDVIIITCAFNEQTKGIFNMDAFKKMKNTAFIVNNARGGIIQQDDLVEALKKGEIAGKKLANFHVGFV